MQPIGCSSAMKRLYEDLFTDYNRLILPVANNKTKVTVSLNLKLGQILDLNLKQQILSTNVWVEQTWHDHKLEWAPELYEGIDMIHVPAENIWIPDIVLFNNADGNYELTLVAKARLYANGTVFWKPPTMFRSTCEIDVEYFPFDIQTCFLRFGSWTYAGDELELKHVGNATKVDMGIDLRQFYKNVEWDIIDVPAYYNEVYYECCSEPVPYITFKIVIRRKMLFYLVNLILPVALMTFMTVSVFYLPSDSNEKVTLSISILTSLIVFFLLMLEIIPASSLAVPLFGKYLLFTLVLVSLSACLSVYVLNIHHRSPSVHSMSPRTRRIFLEILPRLLRLNRPDPHERSSLNRFRKKKIAQQMLNNPAANGNYDLAQSMAASLNLIETLHKSYSVKADRCQAQDDQSESVDDEGRYFRRYVDGYIDRLKKAKVEEEEEAGNINNGNLTTCECESRKLRNCCEHEKCCSRANRPLQEQFGNILRSRGNQELKNKFCGPSCDWTSSGADMMRPLVQPNKINSLDESSTTCNNCASSRGLSSMRQFSGCKSATISNHALLKRPQHSHTGMVQDDTLDMTFDYDAEQDNNINNNGFASLSGRCSAAGTNLFASIEHNDDELPSPPPPPKQLVQLSDSIHNLSGRHSGCSNNLVHSQHSDESYEGVPHLEDHGQLVDKLINSINLINNNSDNLDTTTDNSITGDSGTNNQQFVDHQSDLNMSFLHNNQSLQPRHRHVGPLTRQRVDRVDNSSVEPLLSAEARCTCANTNSSLPLRADNIKTCTNQRNSVGAAAKQPGDLLMSLRLSYDQMPAHVRAAIRSILFIADTIKNEDDENSAIEDWESMSMVVDRLFLWIFFLLCTFGSVIILALAPSLYDKRLPIEDEHQLEIPFTNCSASNPSYKIA